MSAIDPVFRELRVRLVGDQEGAELVLAQVAGRMQLTRHSELLVAHVALRFPTNMMRRASLVLVLRGEARAQLSIPAKVMRPVIAMLEDVAREMEAASEDDNEYEAAHGGHFPRPGERRP